MPYLLGLHQLKIMICILKVDDDVFLNFNYHYFYFRLSKKQQPE